MAPVVRRTPSMSNEAEVCGDEPNDEKHHIENADLEQPHAAGGADVQPTLVRGHTLGHDDPSRLRRKQSWSFSDVSTRTLKNILNLQDIIKGELDPAAADELSHLVELVSFKGCEELCRATTMEVVLSKGGELFQNSAGFASTYALSEQVKSISVFLSHNWSTARWLKSLTLMLHFNLFPAMLCTAVFCVFIGWLSYLDFSYRQMDGNFPLSGSFPRGILFRLTCVPAFLFFLFLWQELRFFQGRKGPSMFLDKVCIHQEDKSIQIRGIRRLAAFLGCSKQMVVVYTDVYLQRLWTVYEIASFITLHPIEKLIVLPTSTSLTVVVGVVINWISHLIAIVMEDQTGFKFSVHICAGLAALAFIYRIRRHCREIAAMHARVQTFQVRDCVCACEEDRPVVYQNIAVLMRACAAVSSDATDDEALDAFNLLARNVLPCALKASIGSFGARYKHILLIGTVMGIPRGLDVDVGVFFGMPSGQMFRVSWTFMAVSWGLLVLVGYLMTSFAGCCLHLKGWLNHAYVITVWFSLVTLTSFLDLCINHLEAEGGVAFYLVVVLFIAAPAGIEYWLDVSNFKITEGLLSKNFSVRRSIRNSIPL